MPFHQYKSALHENPFDFKSVNESEIELILKTINVHTTAGVDNITAKLAKIQNPNLLTTLTKIVNFSIKQCKIPEKIKIARITPLHKSGSLENCKNYHPISILPIFSKITENIINTQLVEHLEKNYLLAENQYGFRSNRSTKDALLSFSTQAYKAFNNGNCMLGIFIDFSKAFDTLDHDILINKLVNLKLGTNAIQ